MNHFSKMEARHALLAAQGLLAPPMSPASKGDLLAEIRRMGYLQIDTIQAVRRSQHLVLWSRLGDYDPEWLSEIHWEGHLFEYYAHALCYIPIEQYPVFRGRMLYDDRTGNNWKNWADKYPDIIEQVREVVQEQGPVSSADFDSRTISTGWGDVKQEKLALQRMFASGELMVPYRENFHRFFDLRERVLPNWDDVDALDAKAALEALILKAVHALGVAYEDWIAPYYQLLKSEVSEALSALVDSGHLHRVRIEDWEKPAYVHPDQKSLAKASQADDLVPNHTTLLSPFDPLVSDRARTKDLFDFDYRLEAYTPVRDRKYGYFCLPILHHGRLIGRLDPKAYRKAKRMEIKSIFLEPGVEIETGLINSLKSTLYQFTQWHGMAHFDIGTTEPLALKEALL